MLTKAIAELGVAYLHLLEQKGKIEIVKEGEKVIIRRKDEGRNLCKVFNAEAGQEEH